MTKDAFSIPDVVKRKIKDLGYELDTSMRSFISDWWSWYTFSDEWHDVCYTKQDGGEGKRRRLSLHPARRACQEWSRLILNEATTATVEKPNANKWLDVYLKDTQFWPNAQALTDKAFGIGTGAEALWFELEGEEVTSIKVRGYDARMVLPLSWDVEGVIECAFCTRVSLKGKQAHQLQIHALEEDGYVIYTYLFKDDRELDPEEHDVVAEFHTECMTPTFGIIKPGVENTKVDLSPFGVSVFDDAIDSMKSVDLAYDSMFQEIELTEAIVFMSDDMIDVAHDKNGKVKPMPKTRDNRLFRMIQGNGIESMYQVYSPDIRIDPIRQALDVALAEFGDLTGFGQDYFTLDKNTGLKTATEVSADNSALMRNIRRHENSISVGLTSVLSAILTCARIHLHAEVEEDFGAVEINYDDSIITDTVSEKNLMLSEIAAGVRPAWHYLMEFDGMSEDEAKAALPQQTITDPGF